MERLRFWQRFRKHGPIDKAVINVAPEVYSWHLSPQVALVLKIVSGGQTGADRAALDWAFEHGIPHGGCCPKGRLAEDGPIDARYPLPETPSNIYCQRTE
jgi:hypothetical protein